MAGAEQVLLLHRQAEFAEGRFQSQPTDEDVHTAVERRLGELIGQVAGKLHTGRSRNDQAATDVRLYMLDEIVSLGEALVNLQRAIIEKAEAHIELIMPGYTHLQPAQPVLFSHWLLSYFWMLERDRQRLDELEQRTSIDSLCGIMDRGMGQCFAIVAHITADSQGGR